MQSDKRLLPIATPAFENESLTSWLIRASLRQGMHPMEFTKYYWGTKNRLWVKDLDFNFPNAQIEQDITLLSNQKSPLTFATLFQDHPQNPLSSTGRATLFLPLTKRNRTAKYPHAYCPLCFENDKTAYLPLTWRFAPIVACPIHSCQLQNTCSHCQAPYAPHLLTYESPYINRCWRCLSPLNGVVVPLSDKVFEPNLLAVFQQDFEQAIFDNQPKMAMGQLLSASEYLSLVLYLIAFVRYFIRVGIDNLHSLFNGLGVPMAYFAEPPIKGLSFGSLSKDERLPIVAVLPYLLNTDIEKWLSCCLASNVGSATLVFEKYISLPKPFEQISPYLVDNTKPNRTKSTLEKPKTYRQVKTRFELLKRKAFGVIND